MKQLLYHLFFAVILVACNAKGNDAESNAEMDSVVTSHDSVATAQHHRTAPPVVINYAYSRPQTEPIDSSNVKFLSWFQSGYSFKDTIVDGITITYRCLESTSPEDYIYHYTCKSKNVYGEPISETTIIYGYRASIIWGTSDKNIAHKDTTLITQDLIADALAVKGEWRKKFMLSNLRFKEVRNDSIIFDLRYFWPDTDILFDLELKFDKETRGRSMTIEDITDPSYYDFDS